MIENTRTYLIKEFAGMGGVSVRTLQYYDRVGLLEPSERTDAGHRLYRQADLLRLQQILTLKYMGFSLDEIDNLLRNPAYDLKRSLEIQKEAIDRQIEGLRRVSQSLDGTIQVLSSVEMDDLDWNQVSEMIRGVMPLDKREWLRRYYTDDQLTQLEARAQQMTPDDLAAGQQAWADLIVAFKNVRQHPPEHPAVQALAAQMADLIGQFTMGDSAIRKSLEQMYKDFDEIPPEYRLYDKSMLRFMNEALKIYEAKGQPK